MGGDASGLSQPELGVGKREADKASEGAEPCGDHRAGTLVFFRRPDQIILIPVAVSIGAIPELNRSRIGCKTAQWTPALLR